MPISDWFPQKKSTRKKAIETDKVAGSRPIPDGVWSKCASCNRMVYQKELHSGLMVCPHCDHHYPLSAFARIELVTDDGSFVEMDAGLTSADPLGFGGDKPYPDTLERAMTRTGLKEAIVTGQAAIGGIPVIIGVMDFRFIAASMGSVVGEKVARAAEAAAHGRFPLVIFCTSGGARMQEGMLSLMQMAKTSAAIGRLSEAGLPYISVLTDPTTGGVSASFATLADVIIAEPKALIGFAGPRVIEQTIRQKLPKDFQSSEFLLEQGLIDQVVSRSELKERLTLILHLLTGVTHV